MNQSERRMYLIKELLKEQPGYRDMEIPANADAQRRLLRSLMNVRMAAPVDDGFLQIQDAYLQEENRKKGFVTLADMEELQEDLYLWRGDITRLAVGAIVNAANSGMTGCYQPCHNCIDNCIHTHAGIQLRNYCSDLMEKQGHEEPTGMAKITPAFNLPCDPYSWPYRAWETDGAPSQAAFLLLPFLYGTGRSESGMQHCILLYFYGGIYVP